MIYLDSSEVGYLLSWGCHKNKPVTIQQPYGNKIDWSTLLSLFCTYVRTLIGLVGKLSASAWRRQR